MRCPRRPLPLAIALLLVASPAAAARATRAAPRESLVEPARELVATTRAYRQSLEKVLAFRQAAVERAAERAGQRADLYARGILSKRELAESEAALAEAREKVDAARREIAQAGDMLAEAIAAGERAERSDAASAATPSGVVTSDGGRPWRSRDTAKLERFFARRFGRPLPISAAGQTTVHDGLGFDHRNAIDVAVTPDSPEGRVLIGYLRAAGVSFMAFRKPVAGAATGAHLHIGRPSRHRGNDN